MKTEQQKCLDGEIFNTSDPDIQKLISTARKLTREYNATRHDDRETRTHLLSQLFQGMGSNVNIDTPFYCDYGKNISLGSNVIININCVFVDCNKITVGNNVLIASNVQLCTATHPTSLHERIVPNWEPQGNIPFFRTYALPISIGDNVWIGAGAIVLPGVSIGANTVIGAGSIVNKSIPANCVAVGNPCKVIRSLESQ